MASWQEQLGKRAAAHTHSTQFRPERLDLQRGEDRQRVSQLLAEVPDLIVLDTLQQQLYDLVKAETFVNDTPAPRVAELVQAYLAGVQPLEYGRWIYYPWSKTLAHVLPEAEFRRLRSDRNRYKITPAEQQTLRDKTIGIVGLSVGRSAAITCAMEGVGGTFRIADFDALDLSNLNRLAAGVADLGVNKAVLAARAMYENDPYTEVEAYASGLTDDNLEQFVSGLDLLVEECDDLYMKIRVRERARALGIPVVMDTSDRGLIDVERFDLDPLRPILHGLLNDVRSEQLMGLKNKDKVPYVLRILDAARMSTEFSATLVEVQETVYTWPQLASGVTLGGALVADVARRILLDHFRESGRYYVDVEQLISDGAALEVPAPTPIEPEAAAEATRERSALTPPPMAADAAQLSVDHIRYLVAHAALAPSGGNTQPWQFRYDGTDLFCGVHPERGATLLDFERRASILALGAAVENLAIAASAVGLACDVTRLSGITPMVRIAFRRDDRVQPSAWAPWLTKRVTNRRYGHAVELTPAQIESLQNTAYAANTRLNLSTDPATLRALGEVLGGADRLRFLSKRMHTELIAELRWTPQEVRADRTGIDLTSLELEPSDVAGMQVLAQWRNLEMLRRLDAGTGLGAMAKKALARSAGFALLSQPTPSQPADYFEGGRALQRLWLQATALGVALHPWSSLIYLAARQAAGAADLSPREARTIAQLDTQLRSLLAVPPDHTPLLAFRLNHADPPTSRSLRLSLDEVLEFDGLG